MFKLISKAEDKPAPGEAGPSRLGKTRSEFLACFALFLIVAGIYFYCPSNGFVIYDDETYVVANPHVRSGLSLAGSQWAFTTTYASNWHPLTWLSHMLDCTLFGLNPAGHHLTSMALHAANTIVLFFLLLTLTSAGGCSFLVAALFAAHPLHVETVAWIAQRKDLLSTFFALLSIYAYVSFARSNPNTNRRGAYICSVLLFAAGLMAKPMVVTLPCLLLLLDYWPLGRLKTRDAKGLSALVLEKVPFFFLSAVASAITIWAQRFATRGLEELPLSFRLENALWSYARYLGKTLYPADLAVFYPLEAIEPAAAVLAAAALAAVSLAVARAAGNQTFLPVGWLWYLGALFPVIGIVQVGLQAMADRYTYMPLTGIFIMLVWGAAAVLEKYPYRQAIAVVCSAGIILVLSVQSFVQVSHWKNGYTLFRHALDVTRDNYVAHNNLGAILLRAGRLGEAEGHFREVLRMAPQSVEAQCNLANIQFLQGNINEAVRGYGEILARADDPNARLGLAAALIRLNRLDEAVPHLEMLLKDERRKAGAINKFGVISCLRGRASEALARFEEAARLDPDNLEFRQNVEHAKKGCPGRNE